MNNMYVYTSKYVFTTLFRPLALKAGYCFLALHLTCPYSLHLGKLLAIHHTLRYTPQLRLNTRLL